MADEKKPALSKKNLAEALFKETYKGNNKRMIDNLGKKKEA